ncbi:hypothetical protein TrLO_g7038 [Triparma laevis f. longispina]|uniref:Uncharacterized protein n=1 Tax=Triparma laevis f. longispina TaxID=1714387 RepID=A0A9W7L0S7_9STRA|nr:hypothetical protein TrLO_g7038 [Triparma laevis f. longispina]
MPNSHQSAVENRKHEAEDAAAYSSTSSTPCHDDCVWSTTWGKPYTGIISGLNIQNQVLITRDDGSRPTWVPLGSLRLVEGSPNTAAQRAIVDPLGEGAKKRKKSAVAVPEKKKKAAVPKTPPVAVTPPRAAAQPVAATQKVIPSVAMKLTQEQLDELQERGLAIVKSNDFGNLEKEYTT